MPAVPLPSNGPASHAPKASADVTLVLGAFPRLRPLEAGPRASSDSAGRVPLTLPSYPAGLAFLRHTLISARLPRVPGEPPRLGSEGSRGEGGRRLPGRPWRQQAAEPVAAAVQARRWGCGPRSEARTLERGGRPRQLDPRGARAGLPGQGVEGRVGVTAARGAWHSSLRWGAPWRPRLGLAAEAITGSVWGVLGRPSLWAPEGDTE